MNVCEKKPNLSLQSLFENDETIDYKSVNIGQIDYAKIKDQQLLILDGLNDISSGFQQSIGSFVENGGSIAIFPSNDINLKDYNSLCKLLKIDEYISKDTVKQKVNTLMKEYPIFAY